MTKADVIRLQEHFQKIRTLLLDAADDALLAMAGSDFALRDEEMRSEFAEHALGYIVHLDLALAALKRERDRILQSQRHLLALAN